MQAFARNCRNQTLDAKGEAEAAKTVRLDTHAKGRGGPTCMSVEGPVIGAEQRGRIRRVGTDGATGNRMMTTVTTDKPFHIEKKRVYEAYKAVRSNRGAAGVDDQTLEQFDEDLGGNLYKIWNWMSSGSYFPPPVRAVTIPKKSGGERILGVPTVGDRIAQMVVKQLIEPDSDLSSCQTPMATGRENRHWTRLKSRASGAGDMTGF